MGATPGWLTRRRFHSGCVGLGWFASPAEWLAGKILGAMGAGSHCRRDGNGPATGPGYWTGTRERLNLNQAPHTSPKAEEKDEIRSRAATAYYGDVVVRTGQPCASAKACLARAQETSGSIPTRRRRRLLGRRRRGNNGRPLKASGAPVGREARIHRRQERRPRVRHCQCNGRRAWLNRLGQRRLNPRPHPGRESGAGGNSGVRPRRRAWPDRKGRRRVDPLSSEILPSIRLDFFIFAVGDIFARSIFSSSPSAVLRVSQSWESVLGGSPASQFVRSSNSLLPSTSHLVDFSIHLFIELDPLYQEV